MQPFLKELAVQRYFRCVMHRNLSLVRMIWALEIPPGDTVTVKPDVPIVVDTAILGKVCRLFVVFSSC